jgi:sterol desaturase/sphingolipid hydroxylase (fatty acid hydroxylase superfamily)
VNYLSALLAVSVVFAVLERLRPARATQRALRPQLRNDLGYLLWNGCLYGLLTGGVVGAIALWTNAALSPVVTVAGTGTALARLPAAVQFVVYLLVADFLQWCVHNLLHRVPWLWQFHKVHHSVQDMDWAANFRFHWMELVVYGSLLHVPLAVLGGDPGPLFAAAVTTTAWGHFNHSNLDIGLGPLAYVFNSPRMHMWHHDASSEGGVAKNFAIMFSLWDWLFRTAYWPRERAPERIGYPRDGEMPTQLWAQFGFPLTKRS